MIIRAVIRDSVARWGGPIPLLKTNFEPRIGVAGTPRGSVSACPFARSWFAGASAIVHVAGIVAIATLANIAPPHAPPEETGVELVFEKPDAQAVAVSDTAPESTEMPAPPAVVPLPPPVADATPAPEEEPVKTEISPARSPLQEPAAVAKVPKPAPRPVIAKPAARVGPPVAAPAPAREAAVPVAPRPAEIVDAGWQAAVSGWLAARRIYPEEARRRGEEGRVAIRFTVDRSGRVESATIVAPSASERLNDGALAFVRQATLPAFPAAMTQARVTITTTMRYSLR